MITHFIEFKGRDGMMVLVRDDEIGIILEGKLTTKGKQDVPVLYLMLRNNTRIEVINETRNSVMQKIMSCTGIAPVILAYQEPEAIPVAAE